MKCKFCGIDTVAVNQSHIDYRKRIAELETKNAELKSKCDELKPSSEFIELQELAIIDHEVIVDLENRLAKLQAKNDSPIKNYAESNLRMVQICILITKLAGGNISINDFSDMVMDIVERQIIANNSQMRSNID